MYCFYYPLLEGHVFWNDVVWLREHVQLLIFCDVFYISSQFERCCVGFVCFLLLWKFSFLISLLLLKCSFYCIIYENAFMIHFMNVAKLLFVTLLYTFAGLEIRDGQQSMTTEFYILTVENLLFVIKVTTHFFVTKVALKSIVIAGERLHT